MSSISPFLPWSLSLYPDAGEAGGCFVGVSRRVPEYVARGHASDSARSAQEAGRRARATLRRYCAANRLNRLGTLTYAGSGCHDPLQVRADVAEFFRALRSALGGEPLPYVWVPEWHKTGHGLHVHFAVGRYVRRSVIAAAWGRGFVHIKLLGDMGVGAGPREEARRAAGYLSKYVAKTFADPEARVLGLHRYDVAQGFKPAKVSIRGLDLGDVLGQACDVFEAAPAHVWCSFDVPEWDRPPAVWAMWA